MPTPIDVPGPEPDARVRGSVVRGRPGVLGDPVQGRAVPPEQVTEQTTPAVVGVVTVRAPGRGHAVEDPAEDASADLMDLASRLGDARLGARLRIRDEEDTVDEVGRASCRERV